MEAKRRPLFSKRTCWIISIALIALGKLLWSLVSLLFLETSDNPAPYKLLAGTLYVIHLLGWYFGWLSNRVLLERLTEEYPQYAPKLQAPRFGRGESFADWFSTVVKEEAMAPLVVGDPECDRLLAERRTLARFAHVWRWGWVLILVGKWVLEKLG